MIRVFLGFLFFAVFFGVCIHLWREMQSLDRWRLTKLTGFSILCALLSAGFLALIVEIF